jgi:hypothetical protein
MLLIKPAAVSGEWFTFLETTDEQGERTPEKDAQFLIRRVPQAVQNRIAKKRAEKVPTTRFSGDGGLIATNNPELARDIDVQFAAYALVEARNAEIPADTVGEKGDDIPLAGRMDDEDFKRRVLTELWSNVEPGCLTKWIIAKSKGLEVLAAEEKADLAKT